MEIEQETSHKLDAMSYEEDIAKNPYVVRTWWSYLQFMRGASALERFSIYERALKVLPASYKLFYAYLNERMFYILGRDINTPSDSSSSSSSSSVSHGTPKRPGHKMYHRTNRLFERALVFLNKMPKVWEAYLRFLTTQKHLISLTRHTFDRALKALPITQHHRIWKLYCAWVKLPHVPNETAVRVFRRYIMLMPENVEEFIAFARSSGRLEEAAKLMLDAVNNEKFVSIHNRSKHDLWVDLCDLLAKNPKEITSIDVDAVIRSGLEKYKDEVGTLWCSLADYYIRAAHFEKARDIYEEAMLSVQTVRDFSQVFDAYSMFEESLISALMQNSSTEDDDLDMEMRLTRLADLMDRRPLLVNSVVLRQNPHNVHEWHMRVQLFKDNPRATVETYKQAIEKINPRKASGKVSYLWIAWAKYYESSNEIDSARAVFDQATQSKMKNVDELANVWCEYAEMELRLGNYKQALAVLKKATTPTERALKRSDFWNERLSIHDRVYMSTKLWSMYADLQENLGTLADAKAAYESMIELKVATPTIILNFASMMEENQYFEEAFKIYEKGVAIFNYPYVYDIWLVYLTKFVKRYEGDKLERARDLFEQAVEHCPPDNAKTLYLMYAYLEENYSLARNALKVFKRATQAVPPTQMAEMYRIYIKKTAEYFGATQTRDIYEEAVAEVPDKDIKDICIEYAKLEIKLGEVDRARYIFIHGSQFCDPRITPKYWKIWEAFEFKYGNEDTYKEFLRLQRSVLAKFNTQVNYLAAEREANIQPFVPSGDQVAAANQMAQLEAQQHEKLMQDKEANASTMFASSSSSSSSSASASASVPSSAMDNLDIEATASNPLPPSSQQPSVNPDAIDIDSDDDSDDEDPTDSMDVQQVAVPKSVFGSVADATATGAADRFKKK